MKNSTRTSTLSMQIMDTTDGQFVGRMLDPSLPIVLGGFAFTPDTVAVLLDGVTRYANSSYVIYAKEV